MDIVPPSSISPVPLPQSQEQQPMIPQKKLPQALQTLSPDQLKTNVPFQDLDNFVDLLRAFQEQDMDILIPLTGFKGAGKTTIGIDISTKYLDKYGEEKFNPARHIAYDNFDVQNLTSGYHALPPYSPILCDEAVRFAMGEDWQKSESKELKKLMTQIRTRHYIILFCLPEFWWLDRKYREDMTVFWIHVFCRGYSLIFTPDLRIGIEDHWHRKEFQKGVPRTINIFTPINEFLSYYRKHPCYWADMSFYKCDERLYARYKKIRDEKALSPSPTITRYELIKLVVWKLKKQFGFSDEKLALYFQNPQSKNFPYSSQQVTGQMINDWVREMEQTYGGFEVSFPVLSKAKQQEINKVLEIDPVLSKVQLGSGQ